MPGAQPIQYNQSKGPMPSMDNSHAHQLSNGDQNTSRSVALETTQAEKVVEDKKEILDSREKMAFYRNKMQDLAEMLAKKHEEKYKQEMKMESNQALVKMDQGGSADGILQVRADRIQSDLEELLKALTERCKKHGIDVKSTAVIELPKGWQPGVPEISAVWDDDWDKFEDEENSALMDDVSEDSYSNAGRKSEKPFETESAYAHSEDESAKSPAVQSSSIRGLDDQGWGTFDNNDDVDSVWGFNSDTAKDAEHEKHGESYFFDSSSFTTSPRKSDSPQGSNSFFQKKSPFGFDDSVPGSSASRAGTSPRYSGGGAENSFFDNFSRYDSFSATDRGSPKQETFSRFDSMSSSTHDNNFSRFDSMSSTAQDRSFARFDSMSSNAGFDHGHTYSFDDSDPFGSSGPFKVSSESQTGKNETDKWAF
ncbi:hypothetical protein CTI12_AA457940 [Artemisia annua]|uniref:Calcium-binding EF hand family protein n=1 Tax=Artemisia annua TaxID=35608 RepID=A0A2U1LTC5_ARTAN|nr:hypothetical protein CTI12_AA457940 [Artemisia annua]